VVETVVVHVLVVWPPLRWSLLALSVYGVLGLVAFDCTTRQQPHVVRGGELLLRFGHFRTARVPLDDLAGVRKHVPDAHSKTLEVDDGGLALSFMGGANVDCGSHPPRRSRPTAGSTGWSGCRSRPSTRSRPWPSCGSGWPAGNGRTQRAGPAARCPRQPPPSRPARPDRRRDRGLAPG
jgi:hypothetical protein